MSKKRKPSITNEQFDILSTLQALNDNKVTPDKARIFVECNETSEDRRYEYYHLIGELVDDGMIDEHKEYYDTAIPWRRYTATKSAVTLLKKM